MPLFTDSFAVLAVSQNRMEQDEPEASLEVVLAGLSERKIKNKLLLACNEDNTLKVKLFNVFF